MLINISTEDFQNMEVDLLGVPVFQDKKYLDEVSSLDSAIKKAIEIKDFAGKKGEFLIVYPQNWKSKRIALIGLGEESKFELDFLRQGIGELARHAKKKQLEVVGVNTSILWSELDEEKAIAIGESLELGNYEYSEFKTEEKSKFQVKEAKVFSKSDIKDALNTGKVIGEGTNIARDLANKPGNHHPPKYFAKFVKDLFSEFPNIDVKIMEEKELSKLGMNALLSVSKGSDEPPKLIIMNYKGGDESDQPIAVVGKGVVFDSGGISLKPSKDMHEMKGDCSGAANTIGVMYIIAKLQLPVNVIGVTPMVENMPSGKATRPGDVVKAYNGKTIEILNTDAEGRMILADALSYTVDKFKPKAIIDMATLTGAMVIALGTVATGVFSNNDELAEQLISAGKESGEKMWRMPLFEEYGEQIKSSVADIQNIGGRPAGSITAAMFLKHFVGDVAWAHLDIAGTAWSNKQKGYIPKGLTGAGTRTVFRYIYQQIKN